MEIDRTAPHDPQRPISEAIPDGPPAERVDEFVELLGASRRRVFLFVMSMVPNRSDAEEIIQETNLLLWRDFEKYRPGTSFGAWACRIAMYQTLAWRKRKRRDRLVFSPELLESLAEMAIDEADRLEERSQALARCIEKLPEGQRILLRLRYGERRGVDAIGRELGRTTDAVYRALSRIRHALHDCVTRAINT